MDGAGCRRVSCAVQIEFDLHVIHVDESSAYGVPRAAAEAHVAAVRQLAASCVEAGRQKHFGYGQQGQGQAGGQAQVQQEGRAGEEGADGAGRPGAAAVAPVRVHVVPLSDVFREDWGQEAAGGQGREDEEDGGGREAREAQLQELLKVRAQAGEENGAVQPGRISLVSGAVTACTARAARSVLKGLSISPACEYTSHGTTWRGAALPGGQAAIHKSRAAGRTS